MRSIDNIIDEAMSYFYRAMGRKSVAAAWSDANDAVYALQLAGIMTDKLEDFLRASKSNFPNIPDREQVEQLIITI